MQLPNHIHVGDLQNVNHVQGIALDTAHRFVYLSFTTSLVKTDLQGNILGTVSGLAGHLGCIAFHDADGKLYGSLEYKHDSIGKGILKNVENAEDIRDGFYIAIFDVEKIDRIGMNAEQDGVMTAVFLRDVYEDYTAEGHRYGCSGIDGTTFAPAFGKQDGPHYLYVAYGIYSDVNRSDNDHQILLQYDVTNWNTFAKPLNQHKMHRSGPEEPNAKYFVYTGNTTFGVQNLEYDPYTQMIFTAVYPGKKECFRNDYMYFIDCTKAPETAPLAGLSEIGERLTLANVGTPDPKSGICGIPFPYGNTGIYTLGDGTFYISEPYHRETGFGTDIYRYRFDWNTATFTKM